MPQLTGIGRFLLQMSSPVEEISSEKEERARAQGPWAGAQKEGSGWGVWVLRRGEWEIDLIRKKWKEMSTNDSNVKLQNYMKPQKT